MRSEGERRGYEGRYGKIYEEEYVRESKRGVKEKEEDGMRESMGRFMRKSQLVRERGEDGMRE